MTKPDLFRDFKTGREVIRVAEMMYVRFPLPLRNVEDQLLGLKPLFAFV
jgi:putative transposase